MIRKKFDFRKKMLEIAMHEAKNYYKLNILNSLILDHKKIVINIILWRVYGNYNSNHAMPYFYSTC